MLRRAWLQIGFRSGGVEGGGAAWERAIACARAAREEAATGPEFGVVSDRDFVLATPLWAYADMLVEHGAFERAANLLAESVAVFRTRGNGFNMADNLGAEGRLALLQGDVERASTLLRESVTLGEALNYRWALGAYQSSLGLATLYRGQVPQARRLLADSLRICRDLNSEFFLTRVCAYLAEVALWEGDAETAERWLAQSLAYPTDRPLGMMDQIERVLVAARLAAAQGAYLRAASLFGLAHELRRGIHYELAGPARQLADAALSSVRAALAPADFAEAFAAGQQMSLGEALAAMVASEVASAEP
jgi:tetratricopeptide (TPR) repeat protein